MGYLQGFDTNHAALRHFNIVARDTLAERERQERKCEQKCSEGLAWLTCADPKMPDGDKLAVLTEEVGEVARELCEARAAKTEPSDNLRVELIQVAAVAMAWAECLT